MNVEELFDLLDSRRRQRGLSQADVGRLAFGNAKDTSLQNLRRGAVPSFERIQALCGALELEFFIGEERNVAPVRLAADDEFVRVARYLVKLAAGAGNMNDNAERDAPMAFRADWMRERGLNANDCVVVSVSGDSMLPTLSDGDLVLVDCTAASQPIKNNTMYAFADTDGSARVKRLHKKDDQLILVSDNPAHDIEPRSPQEANDMNVIGRVVWSGHTV